jgi:hypothetical protein
MPSALKAAVTASPMAGSSRKNSALRQDRDLTAQPGEGLRQLDSDHRRADDGQPLRD